MALAGGRGRKRKKKRVYEYQNHQELAEGVTLQRIALKTEHNGSHRRDERHHHHHHNG
jgi:hypothetical protein